MTTPIFNEKCELRAEKISYEINDKLIIKKIFFSITSGAMLFIKGNNGSGKTTLLRILSGLMQPDEGQTLWNNQRIEEDRIEFNQQLTYIGHSTGVKAELSTLENINFFSSLCGLPQKENSQSAIEWAGLSGYEHSRIAFTRLLMEPSRLWILDEPFTGLDKEMIATLETSFKNHLNNGGLLVLTSHQHVELEQISTKYFHLGS